MTWLQDAHNQWHNIYGRDAVCPLDCNPDPYYFEEDDDYYDTEVEVTTAF